MLKIRIFSPFQYFDSMGGSPAPPRNSLELARASPTNTDPKNEGKTAPVTYYCVPPINNNPHGNIRGLLSSHYKNKRGSSISSPFPQFFSLPPFRKWGFGFEKEPSTHTHTLAAEIRVFFLFWNLI
ncbi:hypothetical protein AAC387_Pa05g2318 [Persea americana]